MFSENEMHYERNKHYKEEDLSCDELKLFKKRNHNELRKMPYMSEVFKLKFKQIL